MKIYSNPVFERLTQSCGWPSGRTALVLTVGVCLAGLVVFEFGRSQAFALLLVLTILGLMILTPPITAGVAAILTARHVRSEQHEPLWSTTLTHSAVRQGYAFAALYRVRILLALVVGLGLALGLIIVMRSDNPAFAGLEMVSVLGMPLLATALGVRLAQRWRRGARAAIVAALVTLLSTPAVMMRILGAWFWEHLPVTLVVIAVAPYLAGLGMLYQSSWRLLYARLRRSRLGKSALMGYRIINRILSNPVFERLTRSGGWPAGLTRLGLAVGLGVVGLAIVTYGTPHVIDALVLRTGRAMILTPPITASVAAILTARHVRSEQHEPPWPTTLTYSAVWQRYTFTVLYRLRLLLVVIAGLGPAVVVWMIRAERALPIFLGMMGLVSLWGMHLLAAVLGVRLAQCWRRGTVAAIVVGLATFLITRAIIGLLSSNDVLRFSPVVVVVMAIAPHVVGLGVMHLAPWWMPYTDQEPTEGGVLSNPIVTLLIRRSKEVSMRAVLRPSFGLCALGLIASTVVYAFPQLREGTGDTVIHLGSRLFRLWRRTSTARHLLLYMACIGAAALPAVFALTTPVIVAISAARLTTANIRSRLHEMVCTTPLAEGGLVRGYIFATLYKLRIPLALSMGLSPALTAGTMLFFSSLPGHYTVGGPSVPGIPPGVLSEIEGTLTAIKEATQYSLWVPNSPLTCAAMAAVVWGAVFLAAAVGVGLALRWRGATAANVAAPLLVLLVVTILVPLVVSQTNRYGHLLTDLWSLDDLWRRLFWAGSPTALVMRVPCEVLMTIGFPALVLLAPYALGVGLLLSWRRTYITTATTLVTMAAGMLFALPTLIEADWDWWRDADEVVALVVALFVGILLARLHSEWQGAPDVPGATVVVVLLFAVVAPVMILLAYEALLHNIPTPLTDLSVPKSALWEARDRYLGLAMVPFVLLAPYTLGWGVIHLAGRWARIPVESATSSRSESDDARSRTTS